VRLSGQPFCVLAILLETPGEVVSRERLRDRLWGQNVFLDHEHSLNSAIKKLRAALNDSPDNSRYIETVPRLGYRFIAPVEELAPIEQEPAAVIASAASAMRARWVAAAGAALVLASLALAYLAWRRFAGPVASPGRQSLAVLPFANLTGDVSQEYLADGLTEELISQIGRIDPQHAGVIARTSVMRYKQAQSIDQIGRELAVQYVLEGSVRREADRVRVTADLIRVKDQTHVWSRQYDRDLSSLLTLQGEIAQEIADEIRGALGNGSRPPITAPAKGPASYEAYDLYLRGRYFWNKRTAEGFRQAAVYFQEAIDRDPKYAKAYAGLADTYGLMSTWYVAPHQEYMPKAREAALRSLRLDGSLAEAHASLALVAESYDYDWQTAENEFRRAIELDPAYATAHQWYGEFLGYQGRFDEAFAESERALQLDPLSLIIGRDHAMLLYYARQYDRAIESSRTVLELDPGFLPALLGDLTGARIQLGRFEEALDLVDKYAADPNDPWRWILRAEVYAKWGKAPEAERDLARGETLLKGSSWLSSTALAAIHAILGHNDIVMERLETAYNHHSNAVLPIKVEPGFDRMRTDPRFQHLLRKLHFAP
jgi:TolB-like protein/DNA-binding winged helix-turn-helix (wHTH) protein/Tfp pilus assembly protein PilF